MGCEHNPESFTMRRSAFRLYAHPQPLTQKNTRFKQKTCEMEAGGGHGLSKGIVVKIEINRSCLLIWYLYNAPYVAHRLFQEYNRS